MLKFQEKLLKHINGTAVSSFTVPGVPVSLVNLEWFVICYIMAWLISRILP